MVVEEEAVDTTTVVEEVVVGLDMEVVTAMESGMRPVGHIREMIVVTAMAR